MRRKRRTPCRRLPLLPLCTQRLLTPWFTRLRTTARTTTRRCRCRSASLVAGAADTTTTGAEAHARPHGRHPSNAAHCTAFALGAAGKIAGFLHGARQAPFPFAAIPCHDHRIPPFGPRFDLSQRLLQS